MLLIHSKDLFTISDIERAYRKPIKEEQEHKETIKARTFNPTYYVPMINPYPTNTVGNPLLWHPAVPPIVQKYNITFGGQDVRRLGEVYEGMLPQQIAVAKNTFNSLFEF